jgi:hypothetical protein
MVLHAQIFNHGPDQVLGFPATGADEDPTPIFHFSDGGFSIHHFFRTYRLQIHPFSLPHTWFLSVSNTDIFVSASSEKWNPVIPS